MGIKATSVWQDFVPKVVDDASYTGLIGMSGSTPHDLFDDFIEELNEKYKEDRAKIKKWAKGKGLIVTSSSTYEWFHEQLKDEDGFLQVPEEHRTNVFESLLTKAKEQDEDVEKNAKKNRKKFVELLQKTREVTATTTYEMATKLLGNSPAWDSVDEQTRRQCFDIFVDQLKIQSEARRAEEDDDEEGSLGESDAEAPEQKRSKKDKKVKG